MNDFFTEAQIAQLSAGSVRMAVLVELGFDPPMRYWNDNSIIDIAGKRWTGLGEMASIDGLVEGRGTASAQVTMMLSGTSPEVNAMAMQTAEDQADKVAEIFFQLFDKDWQLVGDPISIWLGITQPMSVTFVKGEDGEEDTRSVTLPAENLFYNRSRPAGGRYTDSDLQQAYPGDLFLSHIYQIKYGANYIFP